MSHSDPIVFAARAASMTDAQLCSEWKTARREPERQDWRQALRDELTARNLRN